MSTARKLVVQDVVYAQRFGDLVSCPNAREGAELHWCWYCSTCIARCKHPPKRTLYRVFDGSENLYCVHLCGVKVKAVRYSCDTHTSWAQIGGTLFMRLRHLDVGSVYGLIIFGERLWSARMKGLSDGS